MNGSRFALAILFIVAGASHCIAPAPYLAITPPFIPWPAAVVVLSGIAEILGGLGLLNSSTRRWAGWGLIALLLAVFPANIRALSTGITIGGYTVPVWMLWARLPLQPLLIAWVYCVGRFEPRKRPPL